MCVLHPKYGLWVLSAFVVFFSYICLFPAYFLSLFLYVWIVCNWTGGHLAFGASWLLWDCALVCHSSLVWESISPCSEEALWKGQPPSHHSVCRGLGSCELLKSIHVLSRPLQVIVSVRCVALLKKITGRNCFVGEKANGFRREMQEHHREIFRLYHLSFAVLIFMHSCSGYPPIAQLQSALTALLFQHSTGSFVESFRILIVKH